MLFTCGLLSAGNPCTDVNGIYHPPHGRIGLTPANNAYARCYWDEDEYIMETGGTMREAALFSQNLSLTRRITTKLSENELEIFDVLENNAPIAEEFMLLYHCNFGFPFLDEDVKLIFPQNTVIPRTDIAKSGLSECEIITKPQDSFSEHVFFRDIEPDKDGNVVVRVENKRFGFGAYIQYDKSTLPYLAQWKSMQSGDYVLGIEPCNCYIHGRKGERENGTLKKIDAFSKINYHIKIGFYDL